MYIAEMILSDSDVEDADKGSPSKTNVKELSGKPAVRKRYGPDDSTKAIAKRKANDERLVFL